MAADIVRVALGSKIVRLECSATLNLKDCSLSINYKSIRRRNCRNSVGPSHEEADPLVINLCDLMELKYFVPKADEEKDAREVSNFLSLRVKPTRHNGLAAFPNCYRPDSDDLQHKYVVIEFRYEKQLDEMRKLMLQHETLQVFISEESRLNSVEAKDFCVVLRADNDEEAQNRPNKSQSQPISTFLAGKKSKEVLHVYPFTVNGDSKEIDNAAEGLNELKEPSNAQCSREGFSLYAHFPSRFAAYNPKALGYFEQVEFYSGLSFAMLNPSRALYATDSSGVFVWEKPVLDNLRALSATKEDGSMQSAQLQFVAYLCELAYTLALGCGNKMPRAT
jgi:hypothetical protein